MNVALDLDGTLVDLVEAVNRLTQDEPLGFRLSYRDWSSWNMADNLEISHEEFISLLDKAWKKYYLTMKPLEPALSDAIKILKNAGHKVQVLSNRNIGTHSEALMWLENNNIYYDSLTFNHSGPSKLEYPLDVLIDDNPNLVEYMNEYPEKVLYLRDQIWNQNVSCPKNVVRVKTVLEACKNILVSKS
mgnify:CR=1 FL=1